MTAPAGSYPAHQPPGLKIIFFTEMWERFSYYGMRALLVLYLVNALGYQRADALLLYGVYTGLVYVTPLLGGYLADRWLGTRLAAVIGGVVMMMGHFAMAFEPLLHIALGLLIVGNGFFKPNTGAMVGQLYDDAHDPRRAGGYTIYYMGVNLGAFLAPLVVGSLGERGSWHWGFASAGVGMAFGLVTLLASQRLLGRAGLRDGQAPIGLPHLPTVLGWAVASVALVWLALQAWALIAAPIAIVPVPLRLLAGALLAWAAFGLQARVGDTRKATPLLTHAERGRVIAIAVVVFFVIFFWLGFEQAGGSMTLFADKQTDRHLLGFEIPASWFQSINPIFIVLLAPLFSIAWTRLDRTRFALPDTAKQGLGMIVLGLGFVVMFIAQQRADVAGAVGPLWLTAVYMLHTLGELMLSPVGLALVSRIAPVRLGGLLMGAWLMATGVANYFAGALEGLLTGSGIPPYAFLLGSSIGAGALLLLLTPLLERLMNRKE